MCTNSVLIYNRYSYCRLADDLVDTAETPSEALEWINKLKKFLDICYSPQAKDEEREAYIHAEFPSSSRSALRLLPTSILNPKSLYALLDGFQTDLEFSLYKTPPIKDEDDLELYASRVASTVGELCLDLVFHHTGHNADKALLYSAACEMGIALQYVNIARDIAVDAAMDRVYLPTTWLKEEDLTNPGVLKRPNGPRIEKLRRRLLGKAFARYRAARPPMDLLPQEARGPLTVAVESYMEIGRVLSEGGVRDGDKATVPAWRRATVAWKTLMGS